MWLWRTVGGFMMVAGHIVFFVNLWQMRPQPEERPLVEQEVPA